MPLRYSVTRHGPAALRERALQTKTRFGRLNGPSTTTPTLPASRYTPLPPAKNKIVVSGRIPPAASKRLLLSALSTVIAWRDFTSGVKSARCTERDAKGFFVRGARRAVLEGGDVVENVRTDVDGLARAYEGRFLGACQAPFLLAWATGCS